MNFRLIALAAAGAAAALAGAYYISSSDADDAAPAPDRAAIETIVREYLLENPEVIIESLNAYQVRQQEAEATRTSEAAKEQFETLVSAEGAWSSGPALADAEVVVVEMFDYHCGFCKRATPLTQALLADEDNVAIIFRELPIIREESFYPAEIALAAREQGMYRELHFALMEASGVLTAERVAEIAAEVGLDVGALETARQAPEIQNAVVANIELAREIGVRGTPAFIIATPDGAFLEVVSGFDLPAIEAAIETARRGGV